MEKNYAQVGNIRIKEEKKKRKKKKSSSSLLTKILVWFMFILMLSTFLVSFVYIFI